MLRSTKICWVTLMHKRLTLRWWEVGLGKYKINTFLELFKIINAINNRTICQLVCIWLYVIWECPLYSLAVYRYCKCQPYVNVTEWRRGLMALLFIEHLVDNLCCCSDVLLSINATKSMLNSCFSLDSPLLNRNQLSVNLGFFQNERKKNNWIVWSACGWLLHPFHTHFAVMVYAHC